MNSDDRHCMYIATDRASATAHLVQHFPLLLTSLLYDHLFTVFGVVFEHTHLRWSHCTVVLAGLVKTIKTVLGASRKE